MSGTVAFYNAWTKERLGSFTLQDGAPVVISGQVHPSVFAQRVVDYGSGRLLTIADGDTWLRALPETFRGYMWGVYIPEQSPDEAMRSPEERLLGGVLDKLKNLHQPKGAKKDGESIGGQFAPKDETAAGVEAAPRDNVPEYAAFSEGPAWDTYHAAREVIRHMPYENMVIVTADGELIESTQKKKTSVRPPWKARKKLKDAWVLHNHPTRETPLSDGLVEVPISPGDIAFAFKYGLTGLEVVTENKVFRAYPGKNGWPPKNAWADATTVAGRNFFARLEREGNGPSGVRDLLKKMKLMENQKWYDDFYKVLVDGGYLRLEEYSK